MFGQRLKYDDRSRVEIKTERGLIFSETVLLESFAFSGWFPHDR